MTATKDSGDVVPAYPRALRSLWVGALVLPRRQKRSRPVSIAPFCVNGEFHDFMTVPYFDAGMYNPNFGGLRVEENVAVTRDGMDVLTAYPRELRSLWGGADRETKTVTSSVNSDHLHEQRNSYFHDRPLFTMWLRSARDPVAALLGWLSIRRPAVAQYARPWVAHYGRPCWLSLGDPGWLSIPDPGGSV